MINLRSIFKIFDIEGEYKGLPDTQFDHDKDFIFELYLPLLQEHIGHIKLSILEKAELTENTIGSVVKLLYAFLWQEHVIDLGGT